MGSINAKDSASAEAFSSDPRRADDTVEDGCVAPQCCADSLCVSAYDCARSLPFCWRSSTVL